jgi:hypothetical protein
MVNSGDEIHRKLRSHEEITDAIRSINDRINGCGFNFKEDSDGLTRSVALAHVADSDKAIIILASFDFSYYHDLEMVFYDVSYSTVGPGYCCGIIGQRIKSNLQPWLKKTREMLDSNFGLTGHQ